MSTVFRSKGQSQVVEQVILFGVGISIAFGFLAAFETFGQDVKDRALEEQMELQADLVSSHVAQLIQTGADGTLQFSLPPTIAGESYSIQMTDQGIAVQVTDQTFLSQNLNGLEARYNLSGRVSSDRDTAVINIDSYNVVLEGS